MRYFLKLAYKGTAYAGWQRQPNAVSVQEKLEDALFTLCREPIKITGCGRTDTGVHASAYYAHMDTKEISSPEKFIYQLNALLPADIAVYEIKAVRQECHARFDATEREYQYHIHFLKNPFLQNQSTYLPFMPDMEKMNRSARLLMEYKDFTSFAKLHSDNLTNLCTVTKADWKQTEHGMVFTIRADRFLRNMVRAIVGTMLYIGKGKLEVDDMKKIIEAKNRSSAGMSASPEGLFLTRVTYPFINE